MNYWLMKSEPSAFSIDDLKEAGTEPWDGIRNYQARNLMRDDMKAGDKVLFYHSSTDVVGVVGTATVSCEAYPDHTSWDPESNYFDPKSSPDNVRWVMVDITFNSHFPEVVTLDDMRAIPALEDMRVIKKGQRLSIQPVTAKEFKAVESFAKKKATG